MSISTRCYNSVFLAIPLNLLKSLKMDFKMGSKVSFLKKLSKILPFLKKLAYSDLC